MNRPLALITGAAGDIGSAIASRLATSGWDLVLWDHPDAAQLLEIRAVEHRSLGAQVETRTFDVTDEAAIVDALDTMRRSRGAPSGVVCCAGYQGTFAPLHHYPSDEMRRVLDVNLGAVFLVLVHSTRLMVDQGTGGAIVNLASMAGVSGAPNMPAYSATKAAVIGLTKSAAKDLAPHGIRVNAVSPAFIGPGRMWDNQVVSQAAVGSQYYATDPSVVVRQMIGMVPLRRYGSPAEVAAVVAFLLSDESSYLTGVNIEVSGGST